MISRLLSGGYSATPTDGFLWVTPRTGPGGDKPPIIVLHGATQTPAQFVDLGTYPNLTQLAFALAAAGYPLIAPLMGGNTWGNDAALGFITEARAYAIAQGAKTGRSVVLGGSMGGGAAYAWARANPTLVACLVQLEPVSDLNDFVVNNRGGLAASVNAAYGGAYNNGTHGPTHNPESFKASLAGVPTQVWYATDDTIVLPATVTSVTTAIGGSADLHTLTGGHTDTALGGVNAATVLSFIAAHV
jgi:hypothetical protein